MASPKSSISRKLMVFCVLLDEVQLGKAYTKCEEIARKEEIMFNGIIVFTLPSIPPRLANALSFTLPVDDEKIARLQAHVLTNAEIFKSVKFQLLPAPETEKPMPTGLFA